MVFKTPGEIELMDEANRIVHGVLDLVADRIQPGLTTRELDRAAEEYKHKEDSDESLEGLGMILGQFIGSMDYDHVTKDFGLQIHDWAPDDSA